MTTLMKVGSWNMLEQELLKSFLEANSDRMVYAFAAGYLEMTGPRRAHVEGKVQVPLLERETLLNTGDWWMTL